MYCGEDWWAPCLSESQAIRYKQQSKGMRPGVEYLNE